MLMYSLNIWLTVYSLHVLVTWVITPRKYEKFLVWHRGPWKDKSTVEGNSKKAKGINRWTCKVLAVIFKIEVNAINT